MINFKSTAISLTIASTLFLSVTPALAVDLPAGRQVGSPSGKSVEKRCEAAIRIIDKRIEQYNKTKDAHLMKYKNMKEHFLALADRLDKKGLDTSKLRADGKTLDNMIAKAASDYAAFIQKLTDAKQFPCGTSQGAFKNAMEQARAQLKVFHSDVKDIRSFFKTVIRPDLQALRAQNKAKEGTGSAK